MTFAFTLLAALSWDAEYDGFVHFRNWDGMLNDLRSLRTVETLSTPLVSSFLMAHHYRRA